MNKIEQDEIQSLIAKGTYKEAKQAAEKIQVLCVQHKEIYKAITNLIGNLAEYVKNQLSGIDVEKILEEIVGRLIDIFDAFILIVEKNGTASVAPVYIVTTTVEGVYKTIPPKIYELLKAPLEYPLQYKSDRKEWKPFSRDAKSIEDIMKDLSEEGYAFKHIYVSDVKDDAVRMKLIIEINENVKDIIAIVDLLAIDNDNEEVAKAFSDVNIKNVITPVDSYLHNDVKDYMEEVRERVYMKLKYFVQSRLSYDFYDPEISGKFTMVKTLRKVLPSRNAVNKIHGLDQNNELKVIRSTF